MHPKKEKQTKSILKEIDNIRLMDALNPKYLFSTTHRELLVQIANGRLKVKKLARKELAHRGLNKEGFWIGYDQER